MTLIRCVVAGIVGLLVGATSGFGLSYLFIATPLQKVLGPRYSEFDWFGVVGVTLFAALIACVAAIRAALGSRTKLRATFGIRNLLSLVLAPQLALLVLTLTLSGEWAWLGLIHLSACLGILAGAGSALVVCWPTNTELSDGDAAPRPLA